MKNSQSVLRLSTAFGLGLWFAIGGVARAERPDFTGLWTNYQRPGGGGGRGAPGIAPAFKPEARARVEKYQRLTAGTNNTPGGFCVGTGMPGSMLGSGGYPMEIMQRPEQINITYEAHGEMRRVYFGDRVANPHDIFPERNGYSVGRWDGDTLVVETDHLVEQIDQRYAHSADATIVERYAVTTEPDGRRVLTAMMTMTDPVFLTEPFTMEKKWQQVPNGRLMTYECTEPQWLEVVERVMNEEEPKPSQSAGSQ
jgi:hypothetical protein